MFAKERQNIIFEMLQKNNAVTTAHLVKTFEVSIETVRKDLLQMETEGRLSRVHGGAVAKGDMKPFFDLKQRNTERGEQKTELSIKATDFISDGDVIAVDAGSTATFFSEVLKERFSKLTIVTHSLDIFQRLSNHKEFEVILCGGHYLKNECAFHGALTMDILSVLHVQKVFLFPSAVSLANGICDFHTELYQIQRQLIQLADEVFILADSGKFEKKALLKIADTEKRYTYITDSNLPAELLTLYRENDIVIYTGGK